MDRTTQKRRPISIYDYPEHLNPFSECHLNFQLPDKRSSSKIIVEKLRKNGTWSSKLTKKLHRSFTWIEKSRLPVDNSPRRVNESRICNDLHNNALYAKQSQVHNIAITRRESCSDVRHEVETTPSEFTPNGNSLEKSKSVENLNKCDTRKRKKRPAPPPPPNATRSPSLTEKPIVEESDQEIKMTNDECKSEEKSHDKVSIPDDEEKIPEPDTEPIQHETELSNELPSEENLQNDLCDESSTKIDESKLTDQIENLQIENDDEEQSKQNSLASCELDDAENRENNTREHLDENDNISSIENKNQEDDISPIKNENIIKKNNPKVTLLVAENEIRNP